MPAAHSISFSLSLSLSTSISHMTHLLRCLWCCLQWKSKAALPISIKASKHALATLLLSLSLSISLSRSHLVEAKTETETAAHAAALAVNFASHFLCKSFSIWASQLLFYFYACFFVLFYSFTFFFSNLCALLASFLSRLLFVLPARFYF